MCLARNYISQSPLQLEALCPGSHQKSVNPVSLLEFALERIGPALPSLFSLLAGGNKSWNSYLGSRDWRAIFRVDRIAPPALNHLLLTSYKQEKEIILCKPPYIFFLLLYYNRSMWDYRISGRNSGTEVLFCDYYYDLMDQSAAAS